ncbi:MAG: monofunctional biosynthetic peptidoglycan transglycosylase [Alloprevotella sp.]|uniref:monofunctional biosynthetic peptidoglycan transglycosylase n=1 Tax=Prevotellamassilia timonensis TaxID=1852370 RepID=UPI001D7DD6E2|nr:monofunctional biosynthetic peptidoglycan transglycosylase [Prevotellamassilia timonensis]MBS7395121.1 monofunctional biosynthetic peptidoglycan transglycosylase [Prevotellamassilia sp.]MCF2635451.1 monofunctional biosynthetic peptidoglycan transglycosylase [Prevotellamassilia timonensis]MDY3802896.1 monofunctional biosynthetic peptidoglycan transglycosylase [Alloprevotella sp.]MDY4565161.1 monofunctional biosynthetic peptidoglycan transglycosylase [Alloprevotella sp.]
MFTFKTITKILKWLAVGFLAISVLSVLVYRWVPVYVTPLMLIRCGESIIDGKTPAIHHRWVPLEEMSKYMPVAVIASEDANFLSHHGFDFDAIRSAAKDMKKGKRRRGASTISQQTAKNVFLTPSSTWLRKGLEAYFTVLIELLWSKERIMEVYLNSIEMGPQIYGVEAVALRHFGCQASELTRANCALIAATLPNPLKFSSLKPSRYMRKRQKQIEHEMRFVPLLR